MLLPIIISGAVTGVLLASNLFIIIFNKLWFTLFLSERRNSSNSKIHKTHKTKITIIYKMINIRLHWLVNRRLRIRILIQVRRHRRIVCSRLMTWQGLVKARRIYIMWKYDIVIIENSIYDFFYFYFYGQFI